MLRAGRHLARHWYPGVGAREVLLGAGVIALAAGIAAGTVLAQRAAPAILAPTTLTAPAPTVTAPSSRPSGGPGATQTTLGGISPTPTAPGPPAASQTPPSTTQAPGSTTTTTTVGETTTTCRSIVELTTPHITLRVCRRR